MARSRIADVGTLLLPVVAAEAGARLLSPHPSPLRASPARAEAYFEEADIERGTRFTRGQLRLALLGEGIRLGVLMLLTERSRREQGRSLRPWRRRGGGEVQELAAGGLAGTKLMGALLVAPLPVAIQARRRAMAIGLDTQSWRGWLADRVKSTGIGAILAGGAGSAAVFATTRWPTRWWVAAAAGSVAGAGISNVLAPVLLAPLFNTFEPLPEGSTRSEVLELARRAGVQVGEVYAVDLSRRTTGANAWVSGLGPTKRVVLSDTLLERYPAEEIRVVVAHELSHVRRYDVWRFLAFSAMVAPASALAVQRLSGALSPRWGPSAIPALALSSSLVAALPGLMAARLSRAIERRADAEALELSGDHNAFVSLMRKLSVQNLEDLRPPWWVRVLLTTHPPTLERIGATEEYRAARPPAAAL